MAKIINENLASKEATGEINTPVVSKKEKKFVGIQTEYDEKGLIKSSRPVYK